MEIKRIIIIIYNRSKTNNSLLVFDSQTLDIYYHHLSGTWRINISKQQIKNRNRFQKYFFVSFLYLKLILKIGQLKKKARGGKVWS
jgi:hypothetical protein